MIIVGCDFHPSYQQVAMFDTETGKIEEHKLMHTTGEAERFYRAIALPVLVGSKQWQRSVVCMLTPEARP